MVSKLWPEALYRIARPYSASSPSPTSSGPSRFSAESSFAVDESVRRVRA
jgi:hypothetical protein